MMTCIKRNFLFILGAGIVLCMTCLAIFAPFLTPYSPTEPNVDMILFPPSAEHLLGTDAIGRDIFTRLLYGARVSLWVGFIAVGISSFIGVTLGLISGYFGGIIDEIIMRIVDIMLCFPSFFLILAVIAFLEPSMMNIMIVIGLTSWTGLTRLVRAETLSLRERDFILAAKLSGAAFPQLFRTWRTAALSKLGQYASGRERCLNKRPLAFSFSRTRNFYHCAWL